jgi:NRAMP (natural resistance-associated macrophage protein)-like metal ion transporter
MRARLQQHPASAASSAPTAVTTVAFGPAADRRNAADRAHRGDLEGALGIVSVIDTGPRHGIRRHLATFVAVLGPGIVVMVADNDGGGISTYAQAGQDYGTRFAWLVLLLVPVLFVHQEMVARLGAVTGAGHARLITERFGRRWGALALADLLALNVLTLVADFIGVAMSLGYFGVSRFVAVPVAAVFLIGVAAAGSFRGWERAMYALVCTSLVAVPLVLAARAHRSVPPRLPVSAAAGTAHGGALLLTVALVGATVAPWQLFFQQSNVVDKRITTRFLGYERADTALGTLLFAVGALGVLLACDFAFGSTALHGAFTSAATTAAELSAGAGGAAGTLFAIALGVGSVLGASAVTLATSYAVGDYFGLRHSLHRRWRDAKVFHRTYAAAVLVAATVVLIPRVPLGLLTVAVQALAGVLLPNATLFLLLLCNDREVLGPLANSRWMNVIAAAVTGGLLALSALLIMTTAAPGIRATPAVIGLAIAIAAVVAWGTLRAVGNTTPASPAAAGSRTTWTMPPIESLKPPQRSPLRSLGLIAVRCYMLAAIAALVARTVQIMLGSG